MYQLAILCYGLSFIAQLAAAIIAISLINKAKKFEPCWLFLAIALTLMLGRRVSPILFTISTGEFNITDAAFSVPISGFIFLGILRLKKVLEDINLLNDQLIRITKTDFLTSALSRRETFERAGIEIARSIRSKQSTALLSLDIDHFKYINDEFGHHVGDEVLKEMVGFLKSKIREVDFIGRIGGEEFLIVLPETGAHHAIEVADRLREGLSKHACYHHCYDDIKITVSIGIAMIEAAEKAEDYSEILQSHLDKADEAMYFAKKHGRNQCHLYAKPLDAMQVEAYAIPNAQS